MWEEMFHYLDPIAMELIKASLGEPSWLDSNEFEKQYNHAVSRFDEVCESGLGTADTMGQPFNLEKMSPFMQPETVKMELGESSEMKIKIHSPLLVADIQPTEHTMETTTQKDEMELQDRFTKASTGSKPIGIHNDNIPVQTELADRFIRKTPKKRIRPIQMGRNFFLIGRKFLEAQRAGKSFTFFHRPSLSFVELRKKKHSWDEMNVDSLEKSQAVDTNCSMVKEEKILVEELSEQSMMHHNDTGCGESVVPSTQPLEEGTSLENFIFRARAEREEKNVSQRVVSYKTGRSKRIQAIRFWRVDQEALESSPTHHDYAMNKRKRKHFIEDLYNDPYMFQSPCRRRTPLQ